MSMRAEALADRILKGAQELAAFAQDLTQVEWGTVCLDEARTVGVLIHHVASAYRVEVNLIQGLAAGKAIDGVTWAMVNQGNKDHATANKDASKEDTLDLLRQNSAFAADAVRELSDEALDKVSPISLNSDAPLTTQYFIEEHPISHPYVHLKSIKDALN